MVEYLSGGRVQGSTVPAIDTSATPDFSDVFTNDDNWTFTNTSGTYWNVGSNRLNWENRIANNASGANHDLGTSFASKKSWLLRFELYIESSKEVQYNGDAVTMFGIHGSTAFNSGVGSGYSSAQDQAHIQIATANSTRYVQGRVCDCTTVQQLQTPLNFTYSNNTQYYCEIKRSGNTYTLRITTNSDYTGGTTAEFTASLTELRYLHLESWGQNSSYESRNGGYIDNMKLWTKADEKDSLTNVPDNTRYEEYNTRKIFRSLSLKTGCKAYYKFDSTSGGLTNQATSANGFADGLGSNVDGTVTGATTSTDKKLGTNSYLFDGNDYVVCGSTSDFNFAHKTGHTVTVAFWFKQSNAPSGGEIIVGTASTSTGGSTGFYLGTHTSGRIFFSLYDGDATTEPINDYLTGNNIIPDTSNWYHYVFTFDDSNLTIYRNGSQVATTSYTASSTTTGNATNSLTLGKAPNASGNYLDGRLDDMGIWDRVLSTSEISELYNSGTGKTVNTAMIWIERNTA